VQPAGALCQPSEYATVAHRCVLLLRPSFSPSPLRSAGGGAGGQAAKDALGNDVKQAAWLATHKAGDRQLTQGLKGDPTYLVVNAESKIEDFGINAVCTHLGCVVPWNAAENKFKCPCHGSQYDFQGKVVRGPAPLSLALAHVNIGDDGTVLFSTWKETDFRTGLAPWWK
jgi:cytochrome b6-f complex iron-sulfur subunit